MTSPDRPSNLPLFRDATAYELRNAVASIGWRRLEAGYIETLVAQLTRKVVPPTGDATGVVSAIDATGYLQTCLPVLERLIRLQTSAYSPHRWLWYLRRTPDLLFEGKYRSTQGYDRNLAEALTTVAIGTASPSITEFVRYPINQSIARHLVRLVAATRLLSQFHVALRYAGKGAQFRFKEFPPEMFLATEVAQAIELYDRRHETDASFIHGRLGLGDPSSGTPLSEFRDDALLFLVKMTPQILPVPYSVGGTMQMARVEANYFPYIKAGAVLLSVFSDARLRDVPVRKMDGALLVLLNLAFPIAATLTRGIASMVQTGYASTSQAILRDLITRFFANAVSTVSKLLPQCELPSGPDELLEVLSGAPTSTWPTAQANVFVAQGKLACLDIAGATNRFVTTFSYPAMTGDVANARGDAFESSVQDIIDQSPWSPPDSIRRLRRVKLVLNGVALTDIDAIGARDDRLLLVSCKSIPYSSAYNAGEYTAIRNAASTVASACEKWRGVADTILIDRRGSNFDFTAYREIICVVVAPFVVFTIDKNALGEAAPGLRMAASANELREWLKR